MLDGCERLHARGLGPASQREVIILRKVVDQTVRQNRGQVKGCTFLTHFQALLTRFLLSLESLRQSPFFVDQAASETLRGSVISYKRGEKPSCGQHLAAARWPAVFSSMSMGFDANPRSSADAAGAAQVL